MKVLTLAGIGAAANLGSGAISAFFVPLIYWLQRKRRPELELSWGQLIGVVILSALAAGLAYSAIARFGFTAETAYKASFPAIVIGLLLAQGILLSAWHLKRNTPTLPVRVFVVLLVLWLVFGGGYLNIQMFNRIPLSDSFWLVAFAPVLLVVAYVLVTTTTRWLVAKPTTSESADGKHGLH